MNLDNLSISDEEDEWKYKHEFYRKLSEPFMEKIFHQIDWYEFCFFSCRKTISDSILKKLLKISDRSIKEAVYRRLKFSDDFLSENHEDIDWLCLSKYGKLSETTIRKFQDRIDWGVVSIHQKLSKEFIIEFHHKLSWKNVYNFQTEARVAESELLSEVNLMCKSCHGGQVKYIIQCGHCICHECVLRLEICPFCRGEFCTHNLIRYDFEKWIQNAIFDGYETSIFI